MEKQMNRYIQLNELAEANGIVIFGNGEDVNIPLGELRQAFAIESKMYNRSFDGLSVANALSIYEKCVAPIAPETVLLHIGDADIGLFVDSPAEFDEKYRKLINGIREINKKCSIAVVSLKNYSGDSKIEEMNKHLKYIADSEKCEYGDIAQKRVWNPKSTMNAVTFVYSVGFVHPLKSKRLIFDLVKAIFCQL